MHQTFYIDADEEISSVIDRLRKSMAVENYFVVPKRAIFLQSIVNLKLLKREGDKMRKKIILVTQEENALAMAARSDIAVQSVVEEMEEFAKPEVQKNQPTAQLEQRPVVGVGSGDKFTRLSSIGTNNFYVDSTSAQADFAPSQKLKKPLVSKNSALTASATSKQFEAKPQRTGQRNSENLSVVQSQSRTVNKEIASANYAKALQQNLAKQQRASTLEEFDPRKKDLLEKMFKQSKDKVPFESKQIPNSKIKKSFFFFLIICLFLLAGVASYLYFPDAQVVVKPNVQTLKIDTDVKATNQAGKEEIIAVRVVSRNEQLTLQYSATGTSSSANGKKAQGTVVVYNEFDKQPQTLVATTRLQAENGKIFRLLKTVTVPGATTVGGQLQAGTISTEVVADQAGSDYNVAAGKFNIMGFQGSQKYEKFYAKAAEKLNGGSGEGSTVAQVTATDLESAKQKTEAALKEKLVADIVSELQTTEISLPSAEKINFDKSTANVKVATVTDVFEYTAVATVQALIFAQADVEKVLKQNPQVLAESQGMEVKIVKVEYVTVEPNFDENTLLLKVHGEVELTPQIDLGIFRKELLGKNEEEMKQLLSRNQDIKDVNVTFWPTFINRIPQFPQRVTVEVAK